MNRRKITLITVASVIGIAALIPLAAPIHYNYMGTSGVFGYCSETHLYFVLPGAIVVGIGFLYLLLARKVT